MDRTTLDVRKRCSGTGTWYVGAWADCIGVTVGGEVDWAEDGGTGGGGGREGAEESSC